MKFGRVPEVAEKARPWAVTRTIGPPPGREDQIGDLEAQVDEQNDLGVRAFRFFIELEDGDLERITAGSPIEVAIFTPQMWPVSVQIWD